MHLAELLLDRVHPGALFLQVVEGLAADNGEGRPLDRIRSAIADQRFVPALRTGSKG